MKAMTVEGTFFCLLSNSLWDYNPRPLSLSSEEWQEVFNLSCRQAVQGIIYDAVKALPSEAALPVSLAAKWWNFADRIEKRNDELSRVAEYQKAQWAEHGIPAVEQKGRTVAAYYRHPEHRISGDIDWWIPDECWEKALDIAIANGCRPVPDSDGDVHYVLSGVVIEHHRKGLEHDGPEGELLMLISHVMHHAMGAGVGLRQVCDLAMAYDYYAGKYDKEILAEYLKKGRMSGFSRVLDALIEWMKAPKMPLENHKAKRLLSLILADGNFGLEKKKRFSGFIRRASFFVQLSPVLFFRFWISLLLGKCFHIVKI